MSGRSSRAASSASEFINQALGAGRVALQEAQKRVPPEWRKQVESRMSEALKPVQAQLRSRASQSEVDRLTKRVEQLAKDVDRLSRNVASGAPAGTAAETAGRTGAAGPRRAAAPKRATTKKA
ncbi:MAG: hypothetical protein ACREPA_01365 [Candidatus Dormibacteraceae bacterium]